MFPDPAVGAIEDQRVKGARCFAAPKGRTQEDRLMGQQCCRPAGAIASCGYGNLTLAKTRS